MRRSSHLFQRPTHPPARAALAGDRQRRPPGRAFPTLGRVHRCSLPFWCSLIGVLFWTAAPCAVCQEYHSALQLSRQSAPTLGKRAGFDVPAYLPPDVVANARRLPGSGSEPRANEWISSVAVGGTSRIRQDRSPFARLTRRVNAYDTEQASVVLFAGGTLQLTPPRGWQVWELPVGREVRLLFSPQAPVSRRPPADAFWWCAHIRPQVSDPLSSLEIAELFARRLNQLEGPRCLVQPPHMFQIQGFPAFRHNFTVPAGDPAGPEERGGRAGFQFVISTPWALYEMCAAAPLEAVTSRGPIWDRTLESLRIEPLDPQRLTPSPDVADATPVLGSWKAFRSRMRLFPDGNLSLHFDPVLGERIDQPDPPEPGNAVSDLSSQPVVLHGTFQARDDLLLVTWADGSRLNFRWRLSGEDLLLTDHEGRISQLRKLLE